MLFCGVDTSNYTTSLALCDREGRIIANFKEPLPVKPGECGLRQSDAVFAHTRNLPSVTSRLRGLLSSAEYGGERIAAYGVSATPRDAEGSYMPCFLTGVAAASAMADSSGVPLYRFSHQNGHIMAALYSSGSEELIESGAHIAFHVSGGTTEALLVEPGGAQGAPFSVRIIGGTHDLNAGQAVDRTGVMLGCKFPCGPALEALAAQSERTFTFARVPVKDGWCNLSGVQNLTGKLFADGTPACDIAAYLFDYLAAVFAGMARQLRGTYGGLPIVWAGGVMSNRRIRAQLEQLGDCRFAEPAFSADNAAGTALLCRRRYISECNE